MGNRPDKKINRNKELFEDYNNKMSYTNMAKKYDLSIARVYNIVTKEKLNKIKYDVKKTKTIPLGESSEYTRDDKR